MGMLASACAAAAALVVALWLVDVPPAHQQVVTIAAKPRHPSPIVHTVAVRQPTPYEQLLMIEPKDKSMSPPANVPVRPAESAPEPPINEQGIVALLDRVRNVKTRSAALEELREMPHPPREQLMGMLHSPLVAQRFAAAQALGAICDDQLARSLDQMIDSDASWREALAVLVSADRSVAGRYLDDSPDRGDSIRSQAAAIRTVLSQTY